jgi:two-component system, NtrC family, response regulator AtoC
MTTQTTIGNFADAESSTEAGLALLVISPNAFAGLPLPIAGSVIVGRSTKCDIQIDDPVASRRHLRMYLDGGRFAVEDLGSANGTRVRQQRIKPGLRVPVAPGEVMEIGSTVLLVHVTLGSIEPRRLWSPDYFEEKVRSECTHVDTKRRRFAVVRLHVNRPGLCHEVVPRFMQALPPPHLFAAYGSCEFELLLRTPDSDEVASLIGALRASLATIDVSIQTGVAWFPHDGRSADALIARARILSHPDSDVTPVVSPPPRLGAAMRAVHEMAARAAQSKINVLLLGEMGVGKEMLAQMIHRLSARAGKPLVAVNCAALAETLIESELFGHQRGAFTGAHTDKAGLLEMAEGGTVLLDEIGEMPASIQAKLLRVIESREVLPVGSVKVRPIDVRFIAATNRDLDAEAAQGKFRSDLLFRLNTLAITIPPLRERRSEIMPLALLFLAKAAREAGRARVPLLSPAAAAALEEYSWPGNVRELHNIMERALVLSTGDVIGLAELPIDKMRSGGRALATTKSGRWEAAPPGLPLTSKQLEDRRRIIEALEVCVWNQSRAAKFLGMPRRTLVAKIVRYDIPRPMKGPMLDSEPETDDDAPAES